MRASSMLIGPALTSSSAARPMPRPRHLGCRALDDGIKERIAGREVGVDRPPLCKEAVTRALAGGFLPGPIWLRDDDSVMKRSSTTGLSVTPLDSRRDIPM